MVVLTWLRWVTNRQTAGYRGWMWTVGRSNFGENDKNPAVMNALARMVELILKARDAAEHAQATRDATAPVRPKTRGLSLLPSMKTLTLSSTLALGHLCVAHERAAGRD